MPQSDWNPEQYLRYENERTRPLLDLLAHVPELPDPGPDRPLRILDIGCGPGNSTAPLQRRWPHARVTGIDNSPQMLDTARATAADGPADGSGCTDFLLADAREYDPAPEHPDLIVSNAMLQWVTDTPDGDTGETPGTAEPPRAGHLHLLTRWIRSLRPGGTIALQVPGNFRAPSHTLLAELRTSPRWHHLLGAGAHRAADAVHQPADYLHHFTGHGCTADVWETTYHTLLPGPDPVLEWAKATALRPVLSVLTDDADRSAFIGEYGAALRRAYPAGPHGTVFPFRRIFAVARRR
jgi:trans-aconitate 2-methyltransferase